MVIQLMQLTDGTLWTWGYNAQGRLGLNNTTPYSSPIQIPGTTWLRIVTGSNTATGGGIKTDGTLWTWGQNYGNLGQNNQTDYSSPVQVPGTNWVNGSFGSTTCYATKTDGTLWAWGNNNKGQLGQNDVVYKSSPVQVGSGTDWDQTNFQGGNTYVSALKTDGTLWVWGQNNEGALGQNSQIEYSSPVQIGGTFENILGNLNGLYAKQTGSS